MSDHSPLALKARYIFPVAAPPLPDGVVTIAGERIVAVGENRSGRPAVDLGNVALVPGLVNAHTHLEFSDLATPLGSPGDRLPDWIRRVIAHRAAAREMAAVDPRPSGLAECARGGATTIGEIATQPWPEASLGGGLATGGDCPEFAESAQQIGPVPFFPPASVTVFWEVIGLTPAAFAEREAAAAAHLSRSWPSDRYARPGLSPHAPYSVHPELFERTLRLAAAAGAPVAMHLAESREELELLAHGTGPFRDLLVDLAVWQADVFRGGRRVLDYLKLLAAAPRALAIHANYLDRDEIDFLAAHADRISVVYCPRTHTYFGHERYPLAALVERGVNVALGTDSRASNPDLSLLAELRHAARTHAEIPPAKHLELATLSGARALGLAHETGTLAAGKLANLAVVALPDSTPADPHELLLAADPPLVATWHRGVRFDSRPLTRSASEGPQT
ncbi:MAG TPA: amidohydrolase family protein [Pirellulales bacterium]|nr:amidohydrolase family protein [Pirellulales bacterium]